MRVQPVDERDSHWEDSRPRFRVYTFRGGDEPMRSWSTATNDITGASVLEVVAWAREKAGADGLFAVALVVQDRSVPKPQQQGLVWLVGTDANVGFPRRGRAALARCHARASRRVPPAARCARAGAVSAAEERRRGPSGLGRGWIR